MPPRLMGRPEEIKTDFTIQTLLHDRFRALYTYWNEMRKSESMPPVSAIDPLLMPRSALPFLSVIEVFGDPPRLRFRLQGTQLVEVIGRDYTWQFLDDVRGAEQQTTRIRWCMSEGRPYMVEAAVTWGAQNYRSYCSLNLPFGTEDDGVSRITSVFTFI